MKPKCPDCGSQNIMYTKRKGLSWCRVCGWEGKIDRKERKNDLSKLQG